MPRAERRQRKKLLRQCDFTEKKTNRQTKLDYPEETARLHSSWQLYDYLIWLTANGSSEELKDFVADPAKFRENWRQTALTFTDQIPVWLKVGVTKK